MSMSSSREKALLLLPCAFFFAVAALVFWQTRVVLVAQNAASGPAQYNAALVPEGLAWLMVILGLWQAGRVLTGRERFEDGSLPPGVTATPPEESALTLRAMLAFVLLVLFVALVPVVGYYLAMPAFLLLMIALLGSRNPLLLIGGPVLITLAAGYAFGGLLNVRLPVGIWEVTLW